MTRTGGWLYRAIESWYEKPRAGCLNVELGPKFILETGLDVSQAYFDRVTRECASKRVIKTGAADCKPEQIPAVIADRACFGIDAGNVVPCDEKPINMKAYIARTIIMNKTSPKRPVYRPLFKILKTSPIYIVCAITLAGVLCCALNDDPYNTLTFNAFLVHLVSAIHRDGTRRWLLLDNASFHGISEVVKEMMGAVGLGVTFTAPSTCFLNPIEEFFGLVHAIFKRRYDHEVIDTGRFVPLNRQQIKRMIWESIEEAGTHGLSDYFVRAVLAMPTTIRVKIV
jgi:hypothetical protein